MDIYIYIYMHVVQDCQQVFFCTILSIQEVSTHKMIYIISSKHKIPHMHEKCMTRWGHAPFIVKDVHYNYTSQLGPNSSLCPWRFSDYILESGDKWILYVTIICSILSLQIQLGVYCW